MDNIDDILKSIDDALGNKNPDQPKDLKQTLLDQIDSAIGVKPEVKKEEVVTSTQPTGQTTALPSPVPQATPVAEKKLTSPIPSAVPSPVPQPTPPKKPELDLSKPSNQILSIIGNKPEEDFNQTDYELLNTLNGKDLYEFKKNRPDISLDDIQKNKIFEYQREVTPFKVPKNAEDWLNLTNASLEFLGKDIPVMVSDITGSFLKGGAKAIEQGLPFVLGQTSEYAEALEAEKLLSPEKRQEVEQWRQNAWRIANTPLKGGEKPNPDSYTDAKYLEKVREGLSPEQVAALNQKYEQKRAEAKQVPFEVTSELASLPENIAFLGTKVGTGGLQLWDSISEQAGLIDKEKAFERWKAREEIDTAKAKMTTSEPRAWARVMDTFIAPAMTGVTSSYIPGLSAYTSLFHPSVEEYMIMYPNLTREEAKAKRKNEIENNVLSSIEEVKKSIPEGNTDLQMFGSLAIPQGFGMDIFGYALNVVQAAKSLTPIAKLQLKKLRYTDDQINAIEAMAQRALKERELKNLEKKQTPGIIEKAAGSTAKRIEATSEFIEKSPTFEKISNIAPYVTGAGLGYEFDPNNPFRGVVVGGLTGGGLKFGLKTLRETPKVIKEIQAARRISAGGEMGPLATLESIAKQQDEVKKLTAELKTLSEGTQEYIDTKKLLDEAKEKAKGIKAGGTEVVDYEGIGKVSDTTKNILKFVNDDIVSNIGEYAKLGVEPTLLGLATGIIDSSDEEELKTMIGQGLVFSIGGRALQQGYHQFIGEDPVVAARKARQVDVDALKTYRDSTPETREEINKLTDWNNVLERQSNKIDEAISELQGLQNDRAAMVEKNKNDPNFWNTDEFKNIDDKIKKAQKVVTSEQKSLSLLKTANVQTRNEFGRNFLHQLARNNMRLNGSLRSGQNNVGFNILSTQQIFDHFRNNPAYRDFSDADIMMAASQQGFYSGIGGSEFNPGASVTDSTKGLIFDPNKPSIVINSDSLRNRMMLFGETPTEALNHETGHHILKIKEIQDAVADARNILFTNEIRDASGNVKEISNGLYTSDDLNEMFSKNYFKNRSKEEIAQIAQSIGLWDYNTNSLNPELVKNYMQEEILADMFANTLSRNVAKDLNDKRTHLFDVANLKMKNGLLKSAVTKMLGYGLSSDIVSEATNANISPEAQSAARNAMRLLESMNGDFTSIASLPQTAPISKAEIKKSKIAAERYGMDSGLFETKTVAQVFDENGKPIGTPIDVTDPAAFEGSWRIKSDGEERLSGYGQIPVSLRQLQVPNGGTLSISKRIVTEADGETPKLLKPEDLKKLQKDRASLFKQAIDTPDYGTPGRFEPVSEGSETYRGSFTPMQIKAIQDLPEGIVPLKIKQYLLDLNEAIVNKDGTRFYVDYAAVMDDKGNYKAFSPKIYDVVPIGLHLSQAGNFLVTTISIGRMMDKLNIWSDRMPNRLDPWNGSKTAFWNDFSTKYLDNWTNGIEGSGYNKQGDPIGDKQLSPDVQKAEVMKSVFNDFLNLFTNETKELNLDRTIIPKRKGDPKNKSLDRTIMSMRIDHMAELLKAEHLTKLPIDYGKAKINFLPERTIEAETERYPTPERGFYSGLQKTIDQKVQGKFASPEQLKAIISNPQNVKSEELKWSNVLGEIDRLSQENNGKVPKDKVMEYLRNEGAVKFEEVTLGGKIRKPNQSDLDRWNREIMFISPENRTPEQKEIADRLGEIAMEKIQSPALFQGYQLPGGENYREVVMTMPNKIVEEEANLKKQIFELSKRQSQFEQQSPEWNEIQKQLRGLINKQSDLVRIPSSEREGYTSSHFPDIPNYVAHMRLNERTDAEGNNGLFIEELQSDRHQAGREKGYVPTEKEKKSASDKIKEIRKLQSNLEPNSEEYKKLESEVPELAKIIATNISGKIPDAPFRKDWGVQLFKRALRDAVDSGKSWIGWTTGDTQAERYDLSKQVDRIDYSIDEDGLYSASAIKGNDEVFSKEGMELSEVEATFGKELAQKMQENKGKKLETEDGDEYRSLAGLDLKVGGEGMEGFYDTILPKEIGKYVAKMGGKVEKSAIDQSEAQYKVNRDSQPLPYRLEFSDSPEVLARFATADEAWAEAEKRSQTPIWRVNITPEMAGKVKGGQLQFMPENFDAIKKADKSLLPLNEQPENQSVSGRLTSGQKIAIDELEQYYKKKTPERIQKLKKDAEESLSARLVNIGIPVSDSKKIASKAFSDIKRMSSGAMQVISGMGMSDLSRMAGTGRPSVETRKGINPSWLTSAFESFETDDALALMKAQQVARQLTKTDQAKVAAGEKVEAARASGVRESTKEQGMSFVIGEKTADQKAFGSSLREDLNAPPRVYASIVEGQKFGSQGNYNLFFEWDKNTPMVITSHHHYGVGNGLTDIHASANIGDKNARSFGDVENEKYDTLPSGKKILDTYLLVGNDGASDIRTHQLMVSIPSSGIDNVKRAFKANGVEGAKSEIDKIIATQLVGQPSQGKTQTFTSSEGVPPYVAVQKNRTEAYVLNPDLSNVKKIIIASNSQKEIDIINKNLAKAFENNGSKLPPISIVSKDSGASKNPGRKAITDKFFNATGKIAFMPEQPTEYESISARIRPLEGISAPTKVVGAKAPVLGEIEPPVKGKVMLPDIELKPTKSSEMIGAEKLKVSIEQPFDEFGEIDNDAENAVRRIAKDRNLGITRDRELAFVAKDENGEIVGGAFTSADQDGYTFDVVVSKDAEGKGVGSKLLDEVINPPYEVTDAYPDAKVKVDVVNPSMKKMLENRGFVVEEKIGKERWIMVPQEPNISEKGIQSSDIITSGEEKITETAVINKDGNIISSPKKTHAMIMEETDYDLDSGEFPPMENFGFLTNTGRFVTQKEAQEIAKKSNQVVGNQQISGEIVSAQNASIAFLPESIDSSTSVKTLTDNENYNEAKYNGNPMFGYNLARKYLTQDIVDSVNAKIDPEKPAVIIPVSAIEGEDINTIPLAVADALSWKLNIPISTDIVKTSSAHNTGAPANARSRTIHNWDGKKPAPGTQIILVDDTYTTGQTLKSLAKYVGEPTAIVTLASGRYGKQFDLSAERENKMLAKAGITRDEFISLYGQEPKEQLTGAQAQQYILNGQAGKEGLLTRFPAQTSQTKTGSNTKVQDRSGKRRIEPDEYVGLNFTPQDKDNKYAEQMEFAFPKGPKTLTYFLGIGTWEQGLKGEIDPQYAVEYDPAKAAAYRAANGDHMIEGDVTQIDPQRFKGIEYFHASPVCKNYSILKDPTRGGEENDLDIRSADAVNKVLKTCKPKFFTLENVGGYRKSEAYKSIKDTLLDLGYKFDDAIYNANEYGSPTDRKRLLLRATLVGDLPAPIKKQGGNWYDTVSDIVNDLPDAPIKGANFIWRELNKVGIDPENVPYPILIAGGGSFKQVPWRSPDEPAYTFTTNQNNVDRILLPGGISKRVTGRAKARMSGFDDSLVLPENDKLANIVIGNGVPPDLVKNVIGPMFTETTNKK